VAIVESQYRGGETFYRGWNLVKRMPFQTATIKVVESIVCGCSFKWMLQQVVGHFLAMLIVSFLETFFLVLWLVFYFLARSKENQGQTQQFSLRNLEDFLDRLRMNKFRAGFNGWLRKYTSTAWHNFLSRML